MTEPECTDLCITAPAPVCAGDTLVRSVLPGECVEGVCQYGRTETACEFGCANAECLGDPCFEVFCTRPPGPWCDGDIAVTSNRVGVCDAGRCFYSESRFDCASLDQYCFNGICTSDDPCDGVFCDTPPAPRCTADNSGVVSFSAGECNEGECEYRQQTTACTEPGQRCVDGACAPDPACVGVACNTPVPDYCDDGVAVTHAAIGTCTRGRCVYEATRESCDAAGTLCVDAACEPEPCDANDCDRIPADTCAGDVAIRFDAEGFCRNNVCTYPSIRIDCAARGEICSAGACVDPCETVTCNAPPADACEGNTALDYRLNGICDAGFCSYEPIRTDCTDFGRVCRGGRCADACTGVDCTTPPADTCDDETTVRVSTFPGVCDGGTCSYATTLQPCPAGSRCQDGTCDSSVTCDDSSDCAPPDDRCEGTVAVRWTSDSVCSAGLCAFDETRQTTDCAATGRTCVDGECRADDPCDGVVCDAPPADSCSGSNALQWSDTGTCAGGSCSYESTLVACGAAGQVCQDGACVDIGACSFTECTVTPAPSCDGNTAVVPTGPGECDPDTGLCTLDVPAVRTPCGTQVCSNGACLARVSAGALVVTEFYVQRRGFAATQTWIELENTSTVAIPLAGVALQNAAGRRVAISSTLTVAPGARVVLSPALGDLPAPPSGTWSDTIPLLFPEEDAITVLFGDTVIDTVDYRGWPAAPGASRLLNVAASATANDNRDNWCLSSTRYSTVTSIFGTPGTSGGTCQLSP